MSFEYLQEVANDYEKLLESAEEYDVIIYAGENENLKEIHAHSFVLRTRSQYFRTVFSKKWAEKKNEKFILKKPNISPKIFKIILRFIYSGKIDLTNLQGPNVLQLLIAVDEFNIQILIPCIQEYMIKHQREFLQQNSVEILGTVYQHESFAYLWNFYLEKISEEPKILFDSEKFINLNASLLELLLKRDDLNLDEIVIWDSLMKWCFAQHSNIPQDVKKWSKEDFTIMERTIHRYIPLIRFFDISPKDFLSKVYPFKGLLPEDLTINILTSHMVSNEELNINIQPPRQSKCIYGSTLIKSQHFAIFSSWIEKKNDTHYNVRNIPYSFNLLCRASKDGDTPATFHAKCDNKGATLIIVKIKNSEQIVGGYNPLDWSGLECKSTPDSFIFSFNDYRNIGSGTIGRELYDSGSAVISDPSWGPIFGTYDNGSHDLCMQTNGKWSSYPNSYRDINIPINYFGVDDYEVFQIIKKN